MRVSKKQMIVGLEEYKMDLQSKKIKFFSLGNALYCIVKVVPTIGMKLILDTTLNKKVSNVYGKNLNECLIITFMPLVSCLINYI